MAEGDIVILIENADGTYDMLKPVQATDTEINEGVVSNKLISPRKLYQSKYQRIHIGTTAPADTTMLWLDTN